MPAVPKLSGRVTSIEIIITIKKTNPFDTVIDKRNVQFTVSQFNSTNDRKISDGSAKLPTNVFSPFVSSFEIILNRPAKYLKKK